MSLVAIAEDKVQSAVHITKYDLASGDVDFEQDNLWPSDKRPPRAIWAIGGGTLNVVLLSGEEETFQFPDGIVPVQIAGVKQTGSTVSTIQVYW